MNKDTITASIIGFGLGLVAAIALWIVPRILPKNTPGPTPETSVISAASDTPASPTTSTKISLDSPLSGAIVNAKSVAVSGQAAGAKLVVVTTPGTSQVLKPTPDGKFSADLELTEGGNQIAVIAYLENETASENLTVFYLPEE